MTLQSTLKQLFILPQNHVSRYINRTEDVALKAMRSRGLRRRRACKLVGGRWRMGWDSNPRRALTLAGFQDQCPGTRRKWPPKRKRTRDAGRVFSPLKRRALSQALARGFRTREKVPETIRADGFPRADAIAPSQERFE